MSTDVKNLEKETHILRNLITVCAVT